MQGAAILTAIGVALAAGGLVNEDNTDALFWAGLGVMVFSLLLVVLAFVDAVLTRSKETRSRERLAIYTSEGRDLLDVLRKRGELNVTGTEQWAERVRTELHKMDPTAVLRERFDTDAGLPAAPWVDAETDHRYTPRELTQFNFLRNRLARLVEIMQESPR